MTKKTPPATTAVAPRPRGRPVPADARRLERDLVAAAHGLFIRHGYDATTMDAVAAEAHSSKRTLYARYPRKELLFEAVVADHTRRGFEPVERVVARFEAEPGLGLRERLLLIGRTFVEQATTPETQALVRTLASAAQRFPELFDARHREGYGRATSLVRSMLSDAGAQEPAIAAQAFYSLLVLAPMYETPEGGQMPDVAAVVDFVLAGARLPARA